MADTYPGLICIGAQRAGTTWLYGCLVRHPRVAMAPFKEVHDFDTRHGPAMSTFNASRFRDAKQEVDTLREADEPVPPSLQWLAEQHGRTIDDAWYADVFAGSPADGLRVDITPTYSMLADAGIDHAVRLCPDVRILVMLRDPIEGSFSHVRMLLKRGGLPADTPTMLRLAAREGVVARSRYEELLERWSARVPRERFRVVFYDDIATRPLGLLEEVGGFAGLDFEPRHVSEAATRVVHRGPEIEMPDEVRSLLVREYVPAIRTLARTYPQAAEWLRTYT